MRRPLVSYVLTSYNIEKYIAESVRCAFDQSYSPLEIIISDDCSTDKTYHIIQEMANSYSGPHKLVLNRNEKNLGIAMHMNKAYIQLASGDIIVAAHGDDISMPDRTFKSYEFLSENSNYTAMSFGMNLIDSQGRHFADNQQHSFTATFRSYSFDEGGNIPAPSRAFYRRVMTEFGPLNADCPTEDELISFRALMLGDNAFLPEIMVSYRKHETSSSNPENFSKFPLELIHKQQLQDMKYAVGKGWISEDQMNRKILSLERAMTIRSAYRIYYAKPTLENLLKLLSLRQLTWRMRLSYLRRHFVLKG